MSAFGDAWNSIAGGAKDLYGWAKHAIAPSTPASPADSIDAQNARTLAQAFGDRSNARPVAAGVVNGTPLNQAQADQARALETSNIGDLQGVASGATPTAADAMLTRGSDAAAAQARGLAAAYSRQNPGAALRSGLAAGNQAQLATAAQAAQQKAEEQAQARGQIGSLTQGMRQADLSAASANQNNALEAQKANQGADLQAEGLNNQYQLGFGNLQAQETNAPIAAQIANQNAAVQTNKQNQEGFGAVTNLIGGGLGSLAKLSDKRAKTNVKRKSFADAMGDKVHGVTFEYKPEHGGEKHEGVIAQEVEEVFPGAVKKGADGLRRVDTGHLTLASAGALAEMNRRLRKLEDRGAA
jgi:hypothetical protein